MSRFFTSKKRSSSVKILVVDDEPDCISIIQCRLEWCHYKVITATNGKDGLEKAANEKPDLVLLDIDMPVMNGHEMLERMRKDPVLKDTPVIMVTALCEAQDVVKASSFGILDYIAKPVDFAKLVERISNALEQKTLSSAKK